jgi:L-amino acid N-acyltransferase YncA
VVIRTARVEDAEDMIGILNPIIAARTYTALATSLSTDQQRAFIRQFPERGIFHVAVDTASGRLVGLQDVEPFGPFTPAFDHVGVIGTFVDLKRRRQGIATRLFAATFEAARRKGYEKFFTYVRGDNEAALQTYLRQGFRVVGRAERHAKIDGTYVDEIMIEKLLSPTGEASRP